VAKVTNWYISLGYNFARTKQGWIASDNGEVSGRFADLSLSVSGASFAASIWDLKGAPGYTATYHGTLASDCSIGLINPPGRWKSNHDPVGGTFTATPTYVPPTSSVSGTVRTLKGAPVAGVVMDLAQTGKVVATYTTGGGGQYHMSGLFEGEYVIGPASDPQNYQPSSRPILLGPSNGTRAGLLHGVHAVVNFTQICSTCYLDVLVKVLEPLRSGLAEHGKRYNEFPVDFVNSPNQGVFRCQSGCTDVVLTVLDGGTHKPVPGATVSVSVSDLARLGRVAGDQYLCPESTDGRSGKDCSNYLPGLKTDGSGQVYVRYWAPGVDLADATTLTATATCSGPSCPHGQPSGSASVKLTVSPYLIYNYTAPLSEEGATELAAWAGGTAIFTKFLHLSVAAPKVLWATLKWLEANEVAVEASVEGLEALEKIEPILGVLEVFQAFTELWERESMISMFLQDTGLNAVGLGGPAFEASAHAAPSNVFATHLVNYGVVVPFNLGADGAWWDIATTLRKLQASDEAKGKQPDLSNWKIRLKVYEVSSCDPSKGDCAPGYINDPGQADPLRPGIQPELEISVSLLDNELNRARTQRELYNFGTYTFTVPYDAIAWNEAQDNRNLLINDFK
jgi:hypothetical protein